MGDGSKVRSAERSAPAARHHSLCEAIISSAAPKNNSRARVTASFQRAVRQNITETFKEEPS